MTYTALSLIQVSRRYRAGVPGCSASVQALRAVSMRVSAGEIVGIAGPAGAGKTTLLLCAAGLLRPDSGAVEWFGTTSRPGPGARRIELVPQGPGREPSCGHRLLALAWMSGHRPDLLLLDQTLDGADPLAGGALCAAARALAARGTAIVVTSRSDALLAAVATRRATLVAGVLGGCRESEREADFGQRRKRSAARASGSSLSARAFSSVRSTNGRSFRSPQ